jgi:hypothetical protein
MTETQKLPPTTVEIETHGNLERFAKAAAATWGWTAKTQNADVDAAESSMRGYTVREPGKGELVLSCGQEEVVMEYWLPEDGRQLFQEIENVAKGQQMSRDRRRGR